MKKKQLSTFTPSWSPATYTKMEVRKEEEEEGKNLRARVVRSSSGEEERSRGEGDREGAVCCGEGRVWIFLVLGILTLVFSGVLTGIYINLRSLTSNMEVIEVMPLYIPASSVSCCA